MSLMVRWKLVWMREQSRSFNMRDRDSSYIDIPATWDPEEVWSRHSDYLRLSSHCQGGCELTASTCTPTNTLVSLPVTALCSLFFQEQNDAKQGWNHTDDLRLNKQTSLLHSIREGETETKRVRVRTPDRVFVCVMRGLWWAVLKRTDIALTRVERKRHREV